MRAALIEFNYYHGETLPSLVSLLNRIDVEVDVYAHSRLLKNDPFVYTPDLKCGSRALSKRILLESIVRSPWRGYDIVILNSTEPVGNMRRLAHLDRPIIGIVHNGRLISSEPIHCSFFAKPDRHPLALAPHVARSLPELPDGSWIAPVMLGTPPAARRQDNGDRILCVQGNLEFERRNYGSLLHALRELVSAGLRGTRVYMVGRNDGADGDIFRARVQEHGLADLFAFSKGELPYAEYYGAISGCDFILPLVDDTSVNYAPYYSDKLSTSVQVALAFQVIPIIESQLARLYGIEAYSFCYERGDLGQAVADALRAHPAELQEKQAGLLRTRNNLLDDSEKNMVSLLSIAGADEPN